jgi:hypothetical protein
MDQKEKGKISISILLTVIGLAITIAISGLALANSYGGNIEKVNTLTGQLIEAKRDLKLEVEKVDKGVAQTKETQGQQAIVLTAHEARIVSIEANMIRLFNNLETNQKKIDENQILIINLLKGK